VYSGRLDSGPGAVQYQLLAPEQSHVCHCKNSDFRVQWPAGLVINVLKQPYAVVHQYDRVAELRALVDSKYGNCSQAGLPPAPPPQPALVVQQ
jgi:hypothetical protein